MRRLRLIRHATTDAVRGTAFPVDEPLDERGHAAASALAGRAGHGEALCSPALRARATAEALALDATPVAALAECDFGAWTGRLLDEIQETDPAAIATWMTDPSSSPHGGESLTMFAARIGTWLDEQATRDGLAVVVTHGGVVRAALVHALGAPLDTFWRIDISPLRLTELHGRDGRWTIRCVNGHLL